MKAVVRLARCLTALAVTVPLFGIAPSLHADELPTGFTLPEPGTTFEWHWLNQNGAMGVARWTHTRNDRLATFIERNSAVRRVVPLCRMCGSARGAKVEFDEVAYRTLWPLEVGKSATIAVVQTDGRRWINETRIVGKETLSRQFGVVDTFVVEETVRREGDDDVAVGLKKWWSVEHGWTMQYTDTSYRTYGPLEVKKIIK